MLYGPVTILVVYLSVRHGRPRLSLAVSVVAMVVTIGAALALIPRYGGEGAAVASSLGYVVARRSPGSSSRGRRGSRSGGSPARRERALVRPH